VIAVVSLKGYNNLGTTLSGSINSTETTITVNQDMSSYSPDFVLTIHKDEDGWVSHENVLVTGVSGSDLTVTRGYESTVNQSWADDDVIEHLNTAAMRRNLPAQDSDLGMGTNSIINSNKIEIGNIGSGTTKPTTQDTFELQIDTDTGTNGELYLVWNDTGTKRTISLGTT